MRMLRFSLMAALKMLFHVFYPCRRTWLTEQPREWDDISLVLILNHTSMFEFVYAVAVPFRYLWRLAEHLIVPVAAESMDKPATGLWFKILAPKPMRLSRKRDDSWQEFLKAVGGRNICIFFPEGRMKRPNGLDKNGQKMNVRSGVCDLLEKYRGQKMLIMRSHGLHHVLPPGASLPKIFQPTAVDLEILDVNRYLDGFQDADNLREAVASDLERRRDEALGKIYPSSLAIAQRP